jgi:hypothetical protein
MKNSQFDAKTFGVGQLITQRKLFRVPPHQRSYAWDSESVRSFLGDIEEAHAGRDSDYFIGLVVVLGPENGEWVLLDGQQRLTTTSLIFAAIRYWLASHGFEEDAKQIDHEYLGVRRLGGDYSSRMQLNEENQRAFVAAVMQLQPNDELRLDAKTSTKRSSNRLLLEAALECREWVEKLAANSHAPERALFDLASFLDARVKVVCVDVSSEVDAYVLFESLNDRGIELSALDLIKNHIIGKDQSLEGEWQYLIEAIGDANPDDFLKVFWTSRYGITQKSQIFRRVKEGYSDASAASQLLHDLVADAEALAALDDDEHPFWQERSISLRDQIFLIRQLGTKQVRPVLLAALRNLPQGLIQELLWLVTVGVVRFQVIGKGRTGVVEKVFGRLCQALSKDSVSSEGLQSIVSELLIPDETFASNFIAHVDARYSRISYLLAEIACAQELGDVNPWDRASRVRGLIESSSLHLILDPKKGWDPNDLPFLRCLGNYVLVKNDAIIASNGSEAISVPSDIKYRSEVLANAAQSTWKAEQ